MKYLLGFVLVAALAGCSGTQTRIATPAVTSDLRVNALVGSVLVQTVSLPAYAAAEELAVETAPGVITSTGELLWADDPERAVTLRLSGHLNEILNATVSPDPWPFPGLPDVGVDVRVSDMLARADGSYLLAGTFFVGGDGIDFRQSSDAFNIVIPLADAEPGTVATAQAQAILDLAEAIARRLGR